MTANVTSPAPAEPWGETRPGRQRRVSPHGWRSTTKPLIRRATESLSGANLLGVVLNDVAFTTVDRYYERYGDEAPVS